MAMMTTTTGKKASATVERFVNPVLHFMATTLATDETDEYAMRWSLSMSGTSLSLDIGRKSEEGTHAGQYTVSLVEIMEAMGAVALKDLESRSVEITVALKDLESRS